MSNRRFKLILFVLLLALLLLCCGFFLFMDRAASRPVDFIPPAELDKLRPDVLIEPDMLRFRSQPAAVDIYSETVYISAEPDSPAPFSGLSCLDPAVHLYIVEDDRCAELPAAVAEGHVFRLAMVKGGRCQQMNLVLSPFPVMDLEVTSSYIDERGHAAYRGDFVFSTPTDSPAVASAAQWNVRGNTSTSREKKSWHLELQKLSGKDMEHELLDLGADSDWVLNPMVFDDLNIREKFAMDFWNSSIYPAPAAERMSEGRYFELIFDGEYFGLYLLQKRVDEDWLGLDPSRDLLFKSTRINEPRTLQENYELVFSPYGVEESFAILGEVLGDMDSIELENLLLVNNYINFLSSADNILYKNMIHVLRYEDGAYRHRYLLWDTDLSLGMLWSDERGIAYMPETAMDRQLMHMDVEALIAAGKLDESELARFWAEQRESVLREENLLGTLDAIRAELEASGALIRDEQRWGLSRQGEDDYASLRAFVTERLEYLDKYYME